MEEALIEGMKWHESEITSIWLQLGDWCDSFLSTLRVSPDSKTIMETLQAFTLW